MRTSRIIAVLVTSLALAVAPSALGPRPTLSSAVIPAVEGQLRVTAAGDYSASSAAAAVFGRIGTIKPDFHVALGDLSYGVTGEEQSWCDLVTANTGAGFPFELIAGNHESNGLNGNINDFSACLPNQLPGIVGTYGRQYYVDVPEINPIARFVFISPGIEFRDGWWDYSAGSSRYNWAAAAIDGARAASIPWVVAGVHMPCLSMGNYVCPSGEAINNLLVSKKVDIVLNGHEHLYQRTKQLSLGTNCTGITQGTYNASCVSDADNSLSKGAGTVFATVGTGGTALRNVNTADTEAPYFAAYSGLNLNPSHGLLDVRFTDTSLTAQFVATSGAFTDSFTIATGAGDSNAPPVASFTNACTELSCSFDGSGSTDSDGTIASYAWNFGDGTTANTAIAQKNYSAVGSYNVTLTVTDDDGSTATAAKQVSVSSASTTGLASDDFERNLSGGWGSADVGGPWTTTGAASAYSVAAGTGQIRIPTSGAGNAAYLGTVSSSATDLTMVLSADKRPIGSSLYLTAIGRKIAGAGEYRAKVNLSANGAVSMALERTSSTGAESVISSFATISGLTYTAGDKLSIRLEVTGTNPTTIRAKIWRVGSPEPTTWQRTVTDTTAALQAQGGVGVATYLSRNVTNAPLTVSVDTLRAAAP